MFLSPHDICRWEAIRTKQELESKTGSNPRHLLNLCQAPSFSSQPKLPGHRNMPPDHHLASLATQTTGGVRRSLSVLHVRNRELARREPAERKAVTSLFMH